jgi:hypothetical protein
MARLIVILLWDFDVKVPQVTIPRFEPSFFAQTIERYKISVGHPEYCTVWDIA